MPDDGASASEKARGAVERVEPTKAQRAAARRAAESKATAPHHYAEVEIDGAAPELVISAAARALREHPRLNGAYRDGAFESYSRVNVGVMIEGDDGPVVPTIFDADTRDAAEIRAELDRLRTRAADGALTAPELAGGTFTIVPVQAAIRSLAPVLNLGQAGTLAVTPATATLACDARVVSAGDAARFLERMRALVEGIEPVK